MRAPLGHGRPRRGCTRARRSGRSGDGMRVGFISDIHGNLLALDAVLADLERQERRPDRLPRRHLLRPAGARVPRRACASSAARSSSETGTRGRSTASRRQTTRSGSCSTRSGGGGRQLTEEDQRVRPDVRPDARRAARERLAACSASTARRARSRTGSSRRRPTTTLERDVRRQPTRRCSSAATRTCRCCAASARR